MKKILLLSAIMAGAMSVNAQSDFKVKEIAKLPVKNITNYDKGVSRTGYGFGDKFYMTDRGAQQLRVFDLGTGEEIARKRLVQTRHSATTRLVTLSLLTGALLAAIP